MQVQTLMSEMHGAAANDLDDGDSGVENRSVRRRRVERDGEQVSTGKKRKKKRNIVELNGWEWYEDEAFEIDRLIGKMVSDGGEIPGRSKVCTFALAAPRIPCAFLRARVR